MSFQSASVLLWFLPVAAFIIALYLLKIRRRDVRVPATFLWPPVTTDVRANALFQKLRPNLLMFLQLLLAFLILFALARPLMRSQGVLGSATVFVVDASASMGATDVSPSRFDAAKARLNSLASTLAPQDQMAIIEAGAETRVIAPLTSDKKRLQEAVRRMQRTDAPNNVGEALRLATALTTNRDGARIVLLSDGAFPEVADFSPGKAEFIYEPIGSARENVAITALEMEETSRGKQLFVALKHAGEKPIKGTLSFYVENGLVDARELEFQLGEFKGETLYVSDDAQQIEVKLEVNDLLKSDNEAILLGGGARALRVLLIGKGNFFLERALALEPNVRLDKAADTPETEKRKPNDNKPSDYDLVIFDGVAPQPVKARHLVLINTSSAEGPAPALGGQPPLKTPSVTVWEREHPALRYVSLSSVLINNALKTELAVWSKTIVESKDAPLIVAGENKGIKWLQINFDLMESDFPLQPGFPIFVANTLRWMGGDRPEERGFTMKAGAPVSLSVPGMENRFTLKPPSGSARELEALDGTLLVRGANQTGLYELSGGSLRIPFAVNLLNQDESNIAPRASLNVGGKTVTAKSDTVSLREIWRPIVLLALALLALEWWVFVKRS